MAFWKFCAHGLEKAGCRTCGSAEEPEGGKCPDCGETRGIHGIRLVPHLEMAAAICGPKRSRLVLEPRGSYKSTLGIECYSLWRILHDPNIRILIASETAKIAADSLRLIKSHLENVRFAGIFGNHVKAKDWRHDRITVSTRTQESRDPTIHMAAVDHAITGLHPDLVLVDDLVGNSNVGSEDMRDKVKDFVAQLVALGLPNTEYVFLGTRWHLDDYYGMVLGAAEDLPDFSVTIRDAEEGNRERYVEARRLLGWDEGRIAGPAGDMLFPEVLSSHFLRIQRRQLTPERFACWYKNDPIIPSKMLGAPADYFSPEKLPDNLRIALAVDTATGGDTSTSRTGYWVGGIAPDGRFYVLEAHDGDHPPSEVIEELFRLVERYKPNSVLVERAGNDTFYKMLLREMGLRKVHFPIQDVIPERRQTKTARIRYVLQPIYFSGIVRHSAFLKDKMYERQLLHFGAMDRDDIVDAAAIGMKWLKPMWTEGRPEPEPPQAQDAASFTKLVTSARFRARRQSSGRIARDMRFRRHHAWVN